MLIKRVLSIVLCSVLVANLYITSFAYSDDVNDSIMSIEEYSSDGVDIRVTQTDSIVVLAIARAPKMTSTDPKMGLKCSSLARNEEIYEKEYTYFIHDDEEPIVLLRVGSQLRMLALEQRLERIITSHYLEEVALGRTVFTFF